MRRSSWFAPLLVAALVAPADAGMYENVFTALDFLATPSGVPLNTTGDGRRVNGQRSGRLRIVPTGLGTGYELQLDRSFGADSTGRPETLHLAGFGELTLAGSTQWTVGYRGEDFRTVSGTLTANNLQYDIRSQLGGQDAELFGAFDAILDFEVNSFGFYNVSLNARNSNSQLIIDGVVMRDEDEANFEVGPVVVEGNVFFDAFVGLLNGIGVDTSGLEGLFPNSPIDEINELVDEQLQEVSLVAGASQSARYGNLLFDAVIGQDGTAAEELITAMVAAPPPGPSGPQVPEPGTLLLIVGGTAAFTRTLRR